MNVIVYSDLTVFKQFYNNYYNFCHVSTGVMHPSMVIMNYFCIYLFFE